MKFIAVTMLAIAAAMSFAQTPCQTKTDCKLEAKVEKDCCAKKLVAKVEKDDCCAKKLVAKVEKEDCGTCATGAKKASSCGMQASADEEFLAEAHKMMMAAEGKKGEACCKSTAAKPMAKGAKGCCNEVGQPAKFKVFVAGKGYTYYGCEGSAKKGRDAHAAKGHKVGGIQKVSWKATRMS